ncbi:MAG: substrate-binding domain-containing protein [Gemmatimonadota bacterium]|nr:substrate-binding domain-containing protein [Gemmatimonadota bacterium]
MGSARLRLRPALALLASAFLACGGEPGPLILAATTSTYDSGLLERLVEAHENARPGVAIRAVVTGSGEALELGRRGDADVLLVHAPDAETRFIAEGHADGRVPIMYNGFLLVGPPDDPAGIGGLDDPAEAFARIASLRAPFVSRGDSSGTHIRELAIWQEAVADLERGGWYLETGQGQGNSLLVASERAAYTLTDEATFAVLGPRLELEPWVQGHASLLNLYSALRPARGLRAEEAEAFIGWLSSDEGRKVIAAFEQGDPPRRLFHPFILGHRLPIPGAHDLEDGSDAGPLSLAWTH